MGKQWLTLFFWAPKYLQMVIAAIKLRHFLLGGKVMTNLDSILKSRDITLSTKIRLVKAMVSAVVMYGYESWTVKKAECRRIAAFELWCWRRLLRVPWTARRSNQSILKEISPECSLEGLMLKLFSYKLKSFSLVLWKMLFIFWQGLHCICRLPWWECDYFNSINSSNPILPMCIMCFSTCIIFSFFHQCHSFQSTGVLPLWLD